MHGPICHAKVTKNGTGVLIVFPVGVRKAHLAALAHIAIRHRLSVIYSGARPYNTLELEIRRLAAVELIIDDLV